MSVLMLLVIGAQSPVLAHDALIPPAQSGGANDSAERAEAGRLTDDLKAAATRPGKATAGPSVQSAVVGAAEQRRAILNQLAQTSPWAVIDLALTPAERAALPAQAQPFVEQPVDLDGELEVLHVDHEDGHSSYLANLVNGSQTTPLVFGGSLGTTKPGDRVKVGGVALSGVATVVTDQMVTIQAGTAPATTGNQRTAIILVTTPGASTHPYANKTSTASLFFSSTSGQSAKAFYAEASYGQVSILGANGAEGSASDVFGPYAITESTCGSTNLRNQALTAADPELNFNAYDRIVLSIASTNCGNGGIGSIRTQNAGTYDGSTQRVSMSWDFGNALGSTALDGKVGGVALHEYGHNLGVWHANALECGGAAIGNGTCTSDEYGDPADVMGNSGGYGHPNGVHKEILNWLSSRVQTVTDSGTFTLQSYESGIVETKVLKVPRTRNAAGAVNGDYYLEYRKPTAAWSAYTSTRPDYASGVLVHTSGANPLCTAVCSPDFSGSGGGGDSNIIDTQPGSIVGTNDFRDAPLVAGETFSDPGAGVTIQVTAATATSATVSVTLTTPRPTIQTVVYPEEAGYVTGGGTFTAGQSITLTAAPASCFVRWRENRTDQTYPNPYTFTAAADRTLEAVYTGTTCSPAPANDTFPGTTVTTGLQSAVTTGATTQTGEPSAFTCAGQAVTVGRSAWYTIAPTTTTQLALSTAGSTFDTVLAVYTGSAVNALTAVACNDDGPTDATSQLQFTAEAGTTYRVQVTGFGGEGGSASLTISQGGAPTPPTPPTPTPTTPTADARQEGPIVIGGSTALGGTATFTVSVKNYGTLVTPAIHPIVDGTTSGGGAWHATGAQPASAAIQPGQTATFVLRQVVSAPGAWTSTGVSLWNDDANAAWQALPANGNSQQVSFTVAMSCSPRPAIAVRTAPTGDGRLAVTVAATALEVGNKLTSIEFASDPRTPNTNALIDLPGVGNGRSAPASVTVPGSPTSYTFYVRRQSPGAPVTVPITVTDACGPWKTFVGGGSGAGF